MVSNGFIPDIPLVYHPVVGFTAIWAFYLSFITFLLHKYLLNFYSLPGLGLELIEKS